ANREFKKFGITVRVFAKWVGVRFKRPGPDINCMYGKTNHGGHGGHGNKSSGAMIFHFLHPVLPVLPVVIQYSTYIVLKSDPGLGSFTARHFASRSCVHQWLDRWRGFR